MPHPDRAPVLLRVMRNGTVESVHRACVVVADPDGEVVLALGDARLPTYVRSAAKPFQALATLELLDEAKAPLDTAGLAIACASHDGSADQQIEAARLLAQAGLDESALQCPAALPSDLAALIDQRRPEPLSHNCSGKHAGFLYATAASGADPASYLTPSSRLQRQVRAHLHDVTGAVPVGPGVDGCGAPAWVLPLYALATAFARLAGGEGDLARVRTAMTAKPEIVGGEQAVDTRAMLADARVVAKRGAEGVLAAGVSAPDAPVGVAVKVADGAARAAGPLCAAVLAALGVRVDPHSAAPPVLGGGRPQGRLETSDLATDALASLRGWP